MRTIKFLTSTLAALLLLASPVFGQAPANDDINFATLITEPLPFVDAVDTRFATKAADDPTDCIDFGNPNNPTVWWDFTPSQDTFVSANTFGSNYDTTLCVYTGVRGSLTQVAANDDAGSLQSRVALQLVAGTTYHFMSGSFAAGSRGDLQFTVEEFTPPTITVSAVGSVDPSTGAASFSAGASSTSTIFAQNATVTLKQRSGRGNIVSVTTTNIFANGNDFDLSAVVKDSFGGKGFVGGKAEVTITFNYSDFFSNQSITTTSEIRLKGKR